MSGGDAVSSGYMNTDIANIDSTLTSSQGIEHWLTGH